MVETTRELDRFDKQAKTIVAAFIGREDLALITDVEPFIAAALRAVESDAMERAAQVAKQSQEDCFCKDNSDETLGGMPCAACMEAARIEGTLHGLAHRALASPAAAPAAEKDPWEVDCSWPAKAPAQRAEALLREARRELAVFVHEPRNRDELLARIDAFLEQGGAGEGST